MQHIKKHLSAWLGLTLMLLTGVALLVVPGGAQAQVDTDQHVNSKIDAADFDPADGVCDADPGPGQLCTLRAAIMQANALPGHQYIFADPNTYRLTVQGSGEDAGATGDLDITGPISFVWGALEGYIVIDASGTNDRALDFHSPNNQPVKINLQYLVVNGGRADRYGGGIRTGAGVDLTLSRSRIEANRAGESGGGIYSAGPLRLEVVSVLNNHTLVANPLAGGGGIFATANVVLENTTVRANSSKAKGGGIFSTDTLSIEQSAIAENSAQFDGGGVHSERGRLYMLNSTVSGNSALFDISQQAYSNGGGLHLIRPFDMWIRNSTIVDNLGFRGGGLYTEKASILEIRGTIFSNNTIKNCSINAIGGSFINRYNLDDGDSCGFGTQYNLNNTAPLLGPLIQLKSETPYHLPMPGSPALEGVLAADAPSCVGTKDQRGWNRPIDANGDGLLRCDIGAVERQSDDPTTTPTPVPPTPTPSPKPNATPTPSPEPPIPPIPTFITE